MSGIPLELITMLGSGLLGGLMTLASKSIEAKRAHIDRLVTLREQEATAVDAARRYSNKGFQFTRRTIAIVAVFSIILLPKLVALFAPEVETLVGYTDWNPGFWFFTDGANEIRWMQFKGLVITPLDTHLMSGIVGLYFGASMVKNA